MADESIRHKSRIVNPKEKTPELIKVPFLLS